MVHPEALGSAFVCALPGAATLPVRWQAVVEARGGARRLEVDFDGPAVAVCQLGEGAFRRLDRIARDLEGLLRRVEAAERRRLAP